MGNSMNYKNVGFKYYYDKFTMVGLRLSWLA